MNGDSGNQRKVFTFTPESVFTINQNRCSQCTRISVHFHPEYAQRKDVINITDKVTKRRGTSPDIVYHYIRDKIINTRMIAGGRIEERIIVEELGLSRTPVRQAFMRMAAEGLIELLPNHGARVPPLNLREVQSFLESFEFMLLATSHLAVKRRSEKDLEEILKHRDAYEVAANTHNIKSLIETNEELHLAIAKASHNNHMTRLTKDLLTKALRLDTFFYRPQYNPKLDDSIANSIEEHRMMVDAIVYQDLRAVEKMVRNHIQSFRRPLMEYLSESEAENYGMKFRSRS